MKKIIIIILIFLLTGCYDYKELNDLAIITGISITKENNTYILTSEIITIDNQNKESKIYTGKGTTIYEAFNQINKDLSKKIYIDHLNILILDETITKNNLSNILDFFGRNSNSKETTYILISKNIELLTNPNISSQIILENLKENNKYLGISNLVTLNDLIDNYLNPNKEITIPSIEIINNQIKLSTLAIFKNNKFLTYISEEDSIIYNLLNNNINNTPMKIDYNNNQYIITEIYNTNTIIKPKRNKLNIYIKGNASIKEIYYKCNLNNPKTLKKIENNLNNKLTKRITTSINNIKKYNTNIYNFKDIYYKYYPHSDYSKIKINIIPNIKIINTGNITEDIYVK